MHQSQYILCLLVILCVSFNRVTICQSETNETEVDQGRESDEEDDDYTEGKEPSKAIADFVGTNLFGDDACEKKCFSVEDMALLAARKEFEYLLPKDLGNNLFDEDSIEALLQYFYRAQHIITNNTDGAAQSLLLKAFYDALGGFLNSYMVPVAKFSFYAGLVTIKATERVIRLFQNCKTVLNTYGLGWKDPIPYCADFNLAVEPLNISSPSKVNNKDRDPCLNLNLIDNKPENEEEIIVSLPKLSTEDPEYLTNIWIPFKRKPTFNLQSSFSAFVLVRYFVYVSKCYQHQHISQDTFNARFKNWLKLNIEPHLDDDILYPGLGAVLRILKTFQDTKVIVRSVVSLINKSPSHLTENDDALEKNKNRGKHYEIDTELQKKDKNENHSFITEKSKESSDTFNSMDDEEELIDDSPPDEEDNNQCALHRKPKQRDLLMIIMMISFILLILIFLVAMISKYMRDLCKPSNPKNPNNSNPQSQTQVDQPKSQMKGKDEHQKKKPNEQPNERKTAGFSKFWSGFSSHSKLRQSARKREIDLESTSSTVFSSNRFQSSNLGPEKSQFKPISSESTTTFCIVEDDPKKIKEYKISNSKLNKRDAKWCCVSCQKHIDNRDPIYTQNPYCPREERKCAHCACQVKSTQTISKNTSKQTKYSFKNMFKSKREGVGAGYMQCSDCTQKITEDNPNCRKEAEKCSSCCGCCDIADSSPIEKKHPHNDNTGGDKTNRNWNCVKCHKKIKQDDPIYFRDPFCPLEKRICSGCHGREKSKLNCILCARTIKGDENDFQKERKCIKCSKGGEFKIKKRQMRCSSCWRVINEADEFYSLSKNQVLCTVCYAAKEIPAVGPLSESKYQTETNTTNDSFLNLDKSYPKAKWICTLCSLPIEKTDPIYYNRPSCPEGKRKCFKCEMQMKPKWICASCGKLIELDDVIYAKDPKCPKNRRKCVKCHEYSKELLPKKFEKILLTDDFVDTLMQYFYNVDQKILKMSESCEQVYAEKAFYDTLGGYLNYIIIPLCKLSYYAGVITLKTTLHVYDLFEQCKVFLNTNGNGWLSPKEDFSNWNYTIEPLEISLENDIDTKKSACLNLHSFDQETENDENMIVSLPKLDPEEKGELSNIWLPFKMKQTFYLKSRHSAFILVKYYVTVLRCYYQRDIDENTFYKRFKKWLHENIEPHLTDDVLYPGLGAILRIMKSLEQTTNKTIRSYTKQKPKHHETKLKPSSDNSKPKKITPIASIKPKTPVHIKDKTNFFRHFFENSDDSELDPEEKSSDFNDEENVKTIKKNYIVTAIAVAIVLLVFVCLVAIVTRNMRQLCKGRRKLKERKADRKTALKQREKAGSNNRKYRYKDLKRIQTEEDTTTTSDSRVSKEKYVGLRRYHAQPSSGKGQTNDVLYCEATPLRYDELKGGHYLEPQIQRYDERRSQRSDEPRQKKFKEPKYINRCPESKISQKKTPPNENDLIQEMPSIDLDIEKHPMIENQPNNAEIYKTPPIRKPTLHVCNCDENPHKKGRKSRATCMSCFRQNGDSFTEMYEEKKPKSHKVICGPFGPTISPTSQPLKPSCSPPKPKTKTKAKPKCEPTQTSPLRFSISKKNKERALAGKETSGNKSPTKSSPRKSKCENIKCAVQKAPPQPCCPPTESRCYHSDSSPRRSPEVSFDSSPKARSDVITPRTDLTRTSPKRVSYNIPYSDPRKKCIDGSSSWETLDSRK